MKTKVKKINLPLVELRFLAYSWFERFPVAPVSHSEAVRKYLRCHNREFTILTFIRLKQRNKWNAVVPMQKNY